MPNSPFDDVLKELNSKTKGKSSKQSKKRSKKDDISPTIQLIEALDGYNNYMVNSFRPLLTEEKDRFVKILDEAFRCHPEEADMYTLTQFLAVLEMGNIVDMEDDKVTSYMVAFSLGMAYERLKASGDT